MSEQKNFFGWYTAANALTVARAGVGLGVTLAHVAGADPLHAAYLGIAGFGATEVDGSIARRFDVVSPEGGVRDHMADLICILGISGNTLGYAIQTRSTSDILLSGAFFLLFSGKAAYDLGLPGKVWQELKKQG